MKEICIKDILQITDNGIVYRSENGNGFTELARCFENYQVSVDMINKTDYRWGTLHKEVGCPNSIWILVSRSDARYTCGQDKGTIVFKLFFLKSLLFISIVIFLFQSKYEDASDNNR